MQFNNPPGEIKSMTTLYLKKPMGRSSLRLALLLIPLVFACFALSPMAQAVSPPPDGGYPGGNTAEGQGALLSLTDGAFNTAVGWHSLFANTTGYLNTGVGAGTLASNIGDLSNLNDVKGVLNTAVGAGALLLNTEGFGNTANGAFALLYNTNGDGNTAVGASALSFNTEGAGNTAVGAQALQSNADPGGDRTKSSLNTAVGLNTLTANTTGSGNTAVGAGPGQLEDGYAPAALGSNTCGYGNTAVGATYPGLAPAALGSNTTGTFNTAVGVNALNQNTTGNGNIAVGHQAGGSLTTGNDNIVIGNEVFGEAGESGTIRIGNERDLFYSRPCGTSPTPEPTGTPAPTPTPVPKRTFIAGIYGQPPGANTLAVVCADDGKLTANASSRRFKHDIKQMDKASEAILALKPVSFRYNNDSTDTPWFGLIAEDVAEINPDLIARDKEGKPFGVRYDQINVMLLNEFLKEHRKNEEQQKQINVLTAQLKEQGAQIQKVSAQFEASKPAPQVVNNP